MKRREVKTKAEKERYSHLNAEFQRIARRNKKAFLSDQCKEIGKNRWQEYPEELYRKDLHDQDNHDGVITDLVPDILECEVKWALESITTNKARGGDGIPVELFQYSKMML